MGRGLQIWCWLGAGSSHVSKPTRNAVFGPSFRNRSSTLRSELPPPDKRPGSLIREIQHQHARITKSPVVSMIGNAIASISTNEYAYGNNRRKYAVSHSQALSQSARGARSFAATVLLALQPVISVLALLPQPAHADVASGDIVFLRSTTAGTLITRRLPDGTLRNLSFGS